jgi:hypothetical protein
MIMCDCRDMPSTTQTIPRDAKAALLCQFCQQPARFMASSAHLYEGRDRGPVWECPGTCGAYVGCHPDTTDPLGSLADYRLRQARMKAHALFDPMWEAKMARDGCSKTVARRAGYAWLAEQLGIPKEDCHISWMDVAMCEKVQVVCARFAVSGRGRRRRYDP